MKTSWTLPGLCFFAAVVGLTVAGFSAEKTVVVAPSLVKALPAETVLLVRVQNISELARKWKESPFYKLKDKAEFAPLMQQLEEGWNEFKGHAQKELKIDLAQLLGACKGEVAFVLGNLTAVADAIGKSLSTGEEPDVKLDTIPLLVSLDTLEGKADFAKNLKQLFDQGRKSGVKVKEEDFRGGKVVTVSRPEDAGDDGPEHIYFGEHGTRYFISLSPDFLKQTIANLGSGATSSLDQVANFQATQKQTGGGGDFFMYLNVRSFVEAVDKSIEASMFGFIWQRLRQLLVGESLNNLGVSANLEKEGLRSKMFLHNGGGADGLLGWFKTPAVAAKPSPLIPAEALSFSTMGINAEQVATALWEVGKTAMMMMGGGADFESQFQQQFGVSLQDIFRSLGSRFHTFTSKGPSGTNPMGDLSIILELKDDNPLKQLLDKAGPMLAGAATQSTYLNRDVFSFATGMPDLAPTFTVTDRYLIFSLAQANVEKVIRRIGKSTSELGESAGFKKFSALLPPKVAGLSYSDEKYLNTVLENLADSIRQQGSDDVPEWFFQIFAVGGRLFGSSGSYLLWKDQGLYSESWAPFRAE